MKKFLLISVLFFFSNITFGQHPVASGEYDSGLKLAYDSSLKKLTGYYENASGFDETTKSPKFSCIFYLESTGSTQKFIISTYYPDDKSEDLIDGNLEVVNDKSVRINLPKEHGGCWNVQHFADEPVQFGLVTVANWIQIRYVASDKAYVYKQKSDSIKSSTYLIKGNFVCIEKIENNWAYCIYYGNVITKGWVKIADLSIL